MNMQQMANPFFLPMFSAQRLPQQQAPPDVALAYDFIVHCNTRMGMHPFCMVQGSEGYEMELAELELHSAQENAFRLACRRLGKYFGGTESELEVERDGADGSSQEA